MFTFLGGLFVGWFGSLDLGDFDLFKMHFWVLICWIALLFWCGVSGLGILI